MSNASRGLKYQLSEPNLARWTHPERRGRGKRPRTPPFLWSTGAIGHGSERHAYLQAAAAAYMPDSPHFRSASDSTLRSSSEEYASAMMAPPLATAAGSSPSSFICFCSCCNALYSSIVGSCGTPPLDSGGKGGPRTSAFTGNGRIFSFQSLVLTYVPLMWSVSGQHTL
eukprot:7385862-Prymnesium_polylepis.1